MEQPRPQHPHAAAAGWRVAIMSRSSGSRLQRWLPMACCLPGLGLALLVGGGLAVAAPVLGLATGTPTLAGLIVMGIACPLTKLIAVLVFRRQMACPMPAWGTPNETDRLEALVLQNARLADQIESLRVRDAAVDGRRDLGRKLPA